MDIWVRSKKINMTNLKLLDIPTMSFDHWVLMRTQSRNVQEETRTLFRKDFGILIAYVEPSTEAVQSSSSRFFCLFVYDRDFIVLLEGATHRLSGPLGMREAHDRFSLSIVALRAAFKIMLDVCSLPER
ncbi:hypothetical protein RF11_09900 [Thelohanellus kitauei]|uniref:Uncharacterized protein n=1 Tax=Thelohanellus kitauei TaxID=669202 RepID=A0A0C2JW37_THEKT|nr:hypothetical protein RF11_09900 [Thelohanellus kitauei]